MLDAIRILFWPDTVDCIAYHQLQCNEQGVAETESRDIFYKEVSDNKEALCLVGVEAVDKRVSDMQLMDKINVYFPLRQQKLFVLTTSLTQAKIVKKFLKDKNIGTVELYGVDPDYYLSVVPLGSKSRKVIERYIVGLKSEPDFKNRIKRIIKRVLIYSGKSESLYEKFLVILG